VPALLVHAHERHFLVVAQSEFNLGRSLQEGLTTIVEFLPKLVGFIVVLVIGYIVARIVKGILTRVLQTVGLDRALHSGQAGRYVERLSPGASPSRLIGSIGFWLVFLAAISIAVSATGVPALTQFLAAIYSYLPKVVAALIIFVIAGVVATAVGALVARTMGDTPTGKVVGTIVPVIVMAIAGFMILDQLEIAPQIVTITYAGLIGSIALGMALAFGLGGRDVAARVLGEAYQAGREQTDHVRQDVETGKRRGEQQGREAKAKVQENVDGSSTPPPTNTGARDASAGEPGRRR
jgi:hypothetical protein